VSFKALIAESRRKLAAWPKQPTWALLRCLRKINRNAAEQGAASEPGVGEGGKGRDHGAPSGQGADEQGMSSQVKSYSTGEHEGS
jgi:hypothetical protein